MDPWRPQEPTPPRLAATSCVEITSGKTRIVLDAGTGLRHVGDDMLAGDDSLDVTLLLSHLHWDHIQGLPFFNPLYVPGAQIQIMSGPNGVMPLGQALRQQMGAPFFPVEFDQVPSRVTTRDLSPNETMTIGGAKVTVSKLNHPDPVYGYRVEVGGISIVYATDTEHFSCVDPGLVKLARGANVLIYDAQYTPEEYSGQATFANLNTRSSERWCFRAALKLAPKGWP